MVKIGDSFTTRICLYNADRRMYRENRLPCDTFMCGCNLKSLMDNIPDRCKESGCVVLKVEVIGIEKEHKK